MAEIVTIIHDDHTHKLHEGVQIFLCQGLYTGAGEPDDFITGFRVIPRTQEDRGMFSWENEPVQVLYDIDVENHTAKFSMANYDMLSRDQINDLLQSGRLEVKNKYGTYLKLSVL